MNVAALVASLAARGVQVAADAGDLVVRPASKLDVETMELLRREKAGLLIHLGGVVSRLPAPLEALVRAAGVNALTVDVRGVPDANRYVCAWAASYLLGDREEALSRLWAVHAVWSEGTN